MRLPFFLALFTGLLLMGCPSSTQNTEETPVEEASTSSFSLSDEAKVHVVYFHGKQRCKSCMAIQKIAEETVKEKFTEDTEVQFVEIDFSKKENEAIADKYEVAWSSLFIISGDQFTNLTDDAFTHALSKPEVLEEIIEKQTREYLNL